jgi:hypothetical protein
MFVLEEAIFDVNGERRKLPLHKLHDVHTKVAQALRAKLTYIEPRDKGAVTRSRQKKYTQRDGNRAKRAEMFVPSLDKHLGALEQMLAEAQTQVVAADALWTMECALGCPSDKDNLKCLFTHKHSFVCHP